MAELSGVVGLPASGMAGAVAGAAVVGDVMAPGWTAPGAMFEPGALGWSKLAPPALMLALIAAVSILVFFHT